MRAKRKLIISMVIIAFVLVAMVATIAMVFALTQQTIKTSLNIGYKVQDIDGTVSATFTVGGVEEPLTAVAAGGEVVGSTLIFSAEDTEDAGSFSFPEDGLALTKNNDNVVIKYTYTNTGDKHYIATMSFDAELTYENMIVEYGIWDFNTNEIKYSDKRYALVVPADKELSYWIRISVANKARSASFTGDFNWYLEGSDKNTLGYEALEAFEYTGSEGEYSAAFNGNAAGLTNGELVIPSEVSGYPVTSISANTSLTAEQKQAVTSVVIPESVSTIGDSAFEGYTNLESVNFEQYEETGTLSAQSESTGLTTIGANAFKDCSMLDNLIIPSTITSCDESAFENCSNLKNITLDTMHTNALTAVRNLANTNGEFHLTIGDSVTSIPQEAFEYCDGLASLEIGDNVIVLGTLSFRGCIGLTNIEIPQSVKTIGASAFRGCIGLSSIEIPSSVISIKENAFNGCKSLTSITISNSVTSIGYYVFGYCESLTSVTIPTSVTSIGTGAFDGCKSLTSVTIPTSVTSIGEMAFINCESLTSVTIPNSVTSIGACAFSYCDLRSVTLPNSLTRIEGGVFLGCYSLTSVTIPNSVTSIGDGAFEDCESLTSITIPNSVAYIGYYAFGYTRLTSVTFENPNGWSVTEDDESFESISSEDLSNTSTAATYLTDTYRYSYWYSY